MKTGDLGYW